MGGLAALAKSVVVKVRRPLLCTKDISCFANLTDISRFANLTDARSVKYHVRSRCERHLGMVQIMNPVCRRERCIATLHLERAGSFLGADARS